MVTTQGTLASPTNYLFLEDDTDISYTHFIICLLSFIFKWCAKI